jgi:spermidine synthase
MYKYNGRLVHQSHDEEGILEVVEEDGVRSLHFGSSPRQSSMLLAEPYKLYSPYARAMMAWQLFKDSPGKLLMVGLGGGILTKYLLHHFPECQIQAVEYRKGVVKIARSHFGLPMDPRLKITVAEGGSYIREKYQENSDCYDMLVIDAFDHEGLAESVRSEAFFDACRAFLNRKGMLVINLWSTDKVLFQQIAWFLGRTFDWRVLFLPARKRGNVIAMAFSEDIPKFTLKQLKVRAEQLENQYQIEFPVFVKDIRKNNAETIDLILKA